MPPVANSARICRISSRVRRRTVGWFISASMAEFQHELRPLNRWVARTFTQNRVDNQDTIWLVADQLRSQCVAYPQSELLFCNLRKRCVLRMDSRPPMM